MKKKQFTIKIFARNQWYENGEKVLLETHQTNDYDAWMSRLGNESVRQFFILEHDVRVYDNETGEEVAVYY